jgi:hypothetical protein
MSATHAQSSGDDPSIFLHYQHPPPMTDKRNVTTVERAFQLARSGACHSVADIRTQLSAEGHEGVHSHLNGASIQRQLRAALAARGASASANEDDEVDA